MGYSKATKVWLAKPLKASLKSHRPMVEEIPDSDNDDEYLAETRGNKTVDGPGKPFCGGLYRFRAERKKFGG